MSTELRCELIDTALAMNAAGINSGTSGNLSVREGEGMLITPSGMAYESLEADDIVFVDGQGKSEGPRAPSSEWRFHLDLYRQRDDLDAIVHVHPVHCAALACLGRGIPAFHYMVAAAGGNDIRCAGYATFGTQALSDRVIEAMRARKACLMANHGLLAAGTSLDAALALAIEVEHLAETYLAALAVGEPLILDNEEMARVLEKFRHYGPARAH